MPQNNSAPPPPTIFAEKIRLGLGAQKRGYSRTMRNGIACFKGGCGMRYKRKRRAAYKYSY